MRKYAEFSREHAMMSKEAKIGLLFSLVFIVAIAVILRNVHEGTMDAYNKKNIMNVSSQSPSNNDLSSTVRALTQPSHARHQSEANGVPGKSNFADQSYTEAVKSSRPQVLDAHLRPVNRVSAENQSVKAIESPAVTPSSTLPGESRYVMALPGGSIPESNPAPLSAGEVEKALNELRNNIQDPAQRNKPDLDKYQQIRDMLEKSQNPVVADNGSASQTQDAVVHVVVKGESLTSVAMKYYGKKEGNRLVNIEKIYNANRDILSSINAVKVGQRLTIPRIEGMESGQLRAGQVTMAIKPVNKTEVKPEVQSAGASRLYTVKENDSLWKIAQRELGSGSRYTEIIKLNAKYLEDSDNLKLGMKLVLPAK
ncbi:MAG: LysM peptidoglycan-binding domain-containing protein [Sedimentisphaerales bacterium]|nr:LysM peptidoglycan-binding domain-containing protein [Sedimentisphaerales bacterium]MBN2842168.1 LysM peptidoglycan-binding domain-containing protein [Sedimentisphaerales bacterium]